MPDGRTEICQARPRHGPAAGVPKVNRKADPSPRRFLTIEAQCHPADRRDGRNSSKPIYRWGQQGPYRRNTPAMPLATTHRNVTLIIRK